MHCDAFPSSLHPSTLGVVARFAVTRGRPLDQASELSPSDSPVFSGDSLVKWLEGG